MREPQGQKSGITAGIRSRQVLRVALVAGFLHLTWALAFFAAGHEIRDFIRIGPNYVSQDDSSRVIEFDPDYEYPSNPNEDFAGEGYDGQFFYFIALDPEHARDYMD